MPFFLKVKSEPSSTDVTWELVRISEFLDLLGQNLHFNKTPGWFLCSVKFEDHWSKPKSLTQWTGLFNFWLHASFSWATFCQCPYVSITLTHFSLILLCRLLWLQGFINAVPSAWTDFPPSLTDRLNLSFKTWLRLPFMGSLSWFLYAVYFLHLCPVTCIIVL